MVGIPARRQAEYIQYVIERHEGEFASGAIAKGGIVVESADQAEARDELQSMVERLRAAAADNPIDPSEIADSVDEVRGERARGR